MEHREGVCTKEHVNMKEEQQAEKRIWLYYQSNRNKKDKIGFGLKLLKWSLRKIICKKEAIVKLVKLQCIHVSYLTS